MKPRLLAILSYSFIPYRAMNPPSPPPPPHYHHSPLCIASHLFLTPYPNLTDPGRSYHHLHPYSLLPLPSYRAHIPSSPSSPVSSLPFPRHCLTPFQTGRCSIPRLPSLPPCRHRLAFRLQLSCHSPPRPSIHHLPHSVVFKIRIICGNLPADSLYVPVLSFY